MKGLVEGLTGCLTESLTRPFSYVFNHLSVVDWNLEKIWERPKGVEDVQALALFAPYLI